MTTMIWGGYICTEISHITIKKGTYNNFYKNDCYGLNCGPLKYTSKL